MVLIILLIINRVVDAGDGHSVIHPRLIDAGGQTVLRHGELSSADQGGGRRVVLTARVFEELPDLLRPRSSGLPKFCSPLVKGVLRERGLVTWRLFNSFSGGLTLDDPLHVVVLEVLYAELTASTATTSSSCLRWPGPSGSVLSGSALRSSGSVGILTSILILAIIIALHAAAHFYFLIIII